MPIGDQPLHAILAGAHDGRTDRAPGCVVAIDRIVGQVFADGVFHHRSPYQHGAVIQAKKNRTGAADIEAFVIVLEVVDVDGA